MHQNLRAKAVIGSRKAPGNSPESLKLRCLPVSFPGSCESGLHLSDIGRTPVNGANSQNMEDFLAAVAATGDKQAFAEVYEHFAPRVKAFLIRGGATPADADDLAQDTMVKVFKKASLFDRSKASASTWIFTIARNARIDALRRAARPAPDAEDPAFAPEEIPRADDLIDQDQRNIRVKKAFDTLPPEQREVMQLHFYEDKPHSEIAERLGTPLGTVKSRLRLAFDKVRKELSDFVD